MGTTTLDRDDVKAARGRLNEIRGRLDEISNHGVYKADGGMQLKGDAAKEFKSLLAESKEIRGALGDITEAEALAKYLDGPADGDTSGARQAMAAGALPALQRKTLGQAFVDSDEFKSRDRNGNMHSDFEVKGADLGGLFVMPTADGRPAAEYKDLYTAAGGTLTQMAFGRTERDPMMPRQHRTQRFRDLFPVASTDATLIQYMRVLGFLGGVNAARPVPERETVNGVQMFGLKPHTSLDFAPAEAPVRVIAHYEVAHRTVLADEPQLRSIVDNELLYGLRLAEDDQLLNGDGTGENILGLLNVPGIQHYPGNPIPTPSPVQDGDTVIDALRRAATRVYMADYEPTGIVMHPFDFETVELQKDANGQYLAAVSITNGAEQRLWRLPVTTTPAMQQGTALVGAMGLGAKIYDREQSNIRVAEQHGDFFLRNAVAILAEERVGLVVPRPESFVLVNLDTAVAAPATP